MTDTAKPGKFWMVIKLDGYGAQQTKHRHLTKPLAEGEADRLARSCPGQVFVILESIEYRVVNLTPVAASTEFKDSLKTCHTSMGDICRYQISDHCPECKYYY